MIDPNIDEYQAREQQRIIDYLTREEKVVAKKWTCCGGIELNEDDKCSVCGEGY